MAIIWLMMGNTNLVNNDGNMVIMMVIWIINSG